MNKMKHTTSLLFILLGFSNTLLSQNLFESATIISTNTNGASSVVGADFDLDGDIDLVAAAFSGDRIFYYENLGLGNFAPQRVISSEVDGPRNVIAADMDGDGDADVLAASNSDNKITYYENLGNGNFGSQIIISSQTTRATGVYAVDLDGDGDSDVLSSAYGGNKISFFENLGKGSFGAESIIASDAFGATSVYAKDLDLDGDADVLASYTSSIVYYENLGAGNFGGKRVITSNARAARSVFAIDLDGDGDADVISASETADLIAYHENLGNGSFGDLKVLTTKADFAEFVYASDLDDDGDADILFTSKFDKKIGYFENLGELSFSNEIIISTEFAHPYSVFVADINGDGSKDVVAASYADNKIIYFKNKNDNLTRIQGRVYWDKNGNNTFDAGDEGIKTSLEIVESGTVFNSQDGGLYSVFLEGTLENRTLKVMLPTILHCDGSKFVNYSYDDPGNGQYYFEAKPGNTVNKDFMLTFLDVNECTSSSGFVYEDLNKNGLRDNGEPGIPGVIMRAQKSKQTTHTDDNGYYIFKFSADIEEKIEYVEHYLVTCGGMFSHTMPADGETIGIQAGMDNSGINFGLSRIKQTGGLPCYDHELCTMGIFREVFPGKVFNFYLDTRTIGENINNSEIRLNFDPSLEFLSANTMPDEIGSDYLIWRFPPGKALARYCYAVQWKLSEITQPGHILLWDANFTSVNYLDPTPVNNKIARQTVVSSEKSANIKNAGLINTTSLKNGMNAKGITSPVTFQQIGKNAEILSRNPFGDMPETLDSADTRLSFVILFENNTMDSISDITIIDTLPPELNALSIQKPFGNHPYEFVIKDSNVLIWRLKNIALPNKKTDAVNYYGFVQFNVSFKEGIIPGTGFSNKARIIFNNGMAETTNEITHRLRFVNASEDMGLSMDEILLYPNPVNSIFTLEINNNVTTEHEIEIVNNFGSTVYLENEVVSSQNIETSTWPAGIYFVKITNKGNQKTAVKKLIKF
jgi:hypothetical protein